jgi:hypothetical protein
MEERKLVMLENRILATVFGLSGIKLDNELLIGFAVHQTLLGQRSV